GINSLAWNFDGNYLALGDGAGRVGIWDTTSGKLIAEWVASTGNTIHALAWSPDGAKIANATTNWGVQVWDVKTKTEIFSTSRAMEDITWSPDATLLAGISQNEIQVWDAKTGTNIDTISEMGIYGNIAWNPNGNQLAYHGANGEPVIIPAPQVQTT